MLIKLDSGLIDLATSHHILSDSSKNDILDIAIVQSLPELFNKGSHDNQTQNFVWTLAKNLSAANIKLITKRNNVNFNDLCSMDIFICMDGTCYCSGGFKMKRNIIPDDETPFSENCPRTITRVCYRGKCYCRLHQDIQKKRNAKKFKGLSGGTTAESSSSGSWYDTLKLYF